MNDYFLAPLHDLAETAPLLTTVWIGFVGGCIGSFLNVVVYRSPLGMSLSHPPSRCPHCERRIRWYDNMPVIGWIRLRGQCRDCHQSISIRYPVVEAIVAVVFVTQWLRDVTFSTDDWSDRGYGFLWHMLLFCSVFCAGLIDWDRQRIPRKVVVFAIVGGAVLLIVTGARGSWVSSTFELNPWVAVAVGCAAGTSMTEILRHRRVFNQQQQSGFLFNGVGFLLGLYLGTVKSAGVVLASCLAVLVWRRLVSRTEVSAVSWLLCVGVIVWIANLV